MKEIFKRIFALLLAAVFAFSLSACSMGDFSVGKLYDMVFSGGEKEEAEAKPSSSAPESSYESDEVYENLEDESDDEIEIVFPSESELEADNIESEAEEEIIIAEPEEEIIVAVPEVIVTDKLIASASSVLIEEGDDYNPGTLIDGDISTTWAEAVRGTGAGEWVKIETADGSLVNITSIEFYLGFQRDKRLFNNNGWPSKVLMEFESGYAQVADFESADEPVTVNLSVPQDTSFVKITILDAEEGAHFDDTCITEIILFGIN